MYHFDVVHIFSSKRHAFKEVLASDDCKFFNYDGGPRNIARVGEFMPASYRMADCVDK